MARKPKSLCGAGKRNGGGTCTRPAGWGTDHPGFGECKAHTGSTQAGNIRAAKLEAEARGLDYQIEPHAAILRGLGVAAWYEQKLRLKAFALDEADWLVTREKRKVSYAPRVTYDIEGDEVVNDGTVVETSVETSTEVELHIWLREHQKAAAELVRQGKVAHDAGVEERLTQLDEMLVRDFAAALDGILTELGVKGDKRAPAAIRKHLALLEGGLAA